MNSDFSKIQWREVLARSSGIPLWFCFVSLSALLSLVIACEENPTVVSDQVTIRLIDEFATASVGPVIGPSNTATKFEPPFVKQERGLLFVPFGTQVVFSLELHPGSALLTRDTKIRGSATGRLSVTWAPEGGKEMVLTRNLAVTEYRAAPLGIGSTQRGQLTLAASTRRASDHPQGGVLLFDPEIQGIGTSETQDRPVPPPDADAAHPNIIVYLVDALRPDHLGCYGYDRGTSPNIDRFAKSAVCFSNALAQCSWTRPSVASLFTGLWPQQHNTISKEATLPPQAETLAEIMRGQGYATAAIVGNGNVANNWGFSQGFSYFCYLENVRPGHDVVRSTEVNEAVMEWLDENGRHRPFFLYIHTVDPHLPYAPPEPYRSEFVSEDLAPNFGSAEAIDALAADKTQVTEKDVNNLIDLYDGEVAANDAAFGLVIEELKERGLYDSSVVVFLSDHGEEFFDHQGWVHGNTLHSEVLDIPLIIKLPGMKEPSTVDQVVDHVDLFSALLDLVGIDSSPKTRGRSFIPLCKGEESAGWRDRSVAHLNLKTRFSISLVDGRWKLILRRRGKNDRVPELYDRLSDRQERTNLAKQEPAQLEALMKLLEAAENDAQVVLQTSLIDAENYNEMKDQLRALGYVQE